MKLLAALAVLSLIHPAPAEFGSDWDDPVIAAPPVARPGGPACTQTIVDTEFRDFTPYAGDYTPACAGPWQKVVLTLEGAVAGRQYDRLGYLELGGVTVFKTSTPEPSPDGIRWSVEKDLTEYADLLTRPQPVEMLIGNVVDETYTGVLDVTVKLTFYRGRPSARPVVVPLDRAVPRNTERLYADVLATGSGGGCEEYWYLTTPTGTPYSCAGGDSPYREVQISVDGVLAGIAAPYPHIYTGGWSNPFLWYVNPAPRAFDIKPITYDLTPFAGLLTDGRAHDIRVSVAGVPAGQTGWDTPALLRAYPDPHRARTTGGLLTAAAQPLINRPVYTDHALSVTGSHALTTKGYLETSHGRVTTTVTRTVANRATHRWNADETQDSLVGTWTDQSTVTTGRKTEKTLLRYGLSGVTTIGADDRLTSTMDLLDAAVTPTGPVTDTWRGTASFTLNVPRDQRHGTATTTEHYRSPGYHRTIATSNGTVLKR